jgi:hypothetical protein
MNFSIINADELPPFLVVILCKQKQSKQKVIPQVQKNDHIINNRRRQVLIQKKNLHLLKQTQQNHGIIHSCIYS